MKLKDATVGILIIGVILMFIVPLPSELLDVLLTINITASVIILLNTIYSKGALDMSIFPSLLLIMTMFRLGLNLTSTKLILGEGEGTDKAGKVVEAFGQFVAGGDMVVGFVIFIIITIVQFMVIVKGSERVAEVAARFTLDAMPGKQMAIDADLNSGLINEEEAKIRRKNVQREADFYGAMDGAGKFVKGDSIAGIIITFINLIGGIILGVMNGQDIMSALSDYALLTIGDGLVSQVPALIISLSTGIIVTRAGAESNLSRDFIGQLFNNPNVLSIASVVCCIFAFTGMPTVPFLILGVVLALVAYKLKTAKTKEVPAQVAQAQAQEEAAEEIRKPENVVTLLQVDPIELEFGYGIIPLADTAQGGDLLDRVVMIRRQLALELGMIVPVIRLRDNIQLSPYEYSIKVKGVEVARGELQNDCVLAMDPGTADGDLKGKQTIEPAFGLPAVWIPIKDKDRAEMKGYTIVDLPSIVATHLTQVVKANAHKLLGRQEVQTLIDNVKERNPVIVEELIPKIMNIGEVQKVLSHLLKEEICIRDMVTILETLADYAVITKDAEVLTEYVRQALSRSISQKYIEKNRTNGVITIEPNLEQELVNSVQKTDFGSYIAVEPTKMEAIINNLSKQVKVAISNGEQPIILTSPALRPYFKKMIEGVLPSVVVLSYNEIDADANVKSIAMLSA